MENRDIEELMRDLIRDFVDEKENGFCESVYEKFYAYLEDSFCEAVNELCKIIIFGREYSLSVQELYDYDHYLATEAWNDYVRRSLEEDFHVWAEKCIREDIEDFISGFQKWLSGNDERASDAIVTLMRGDIDLTKIIVDWLCDRLGYEYWKYPA